MASYKPKHSRKSASHVGPIRRLFGDSQQGFGRLSRLWNRRKAPSRGYRATKRTRWISPRYLLVAMLFLTVAIAGGVGLYHHLAASDVFRLTELSVQGNRIVEKKEIIEQSGLHQGVGLLGFDLDAARRRIEDLAWIDTAHLRIVWPARVEITVREHRPLALVREAGKKDGGLSYLDSKGRIFAPVRPGQEIDFPVLTDLPPTAAEGDESGRPSLRASAIRLLRLAARGNAILPVQAISEVHCDPDKGLVLYLVDHPFPIYMGRERISTKYYRLIRILDRVYRKKKIAGIREIYMDYMENKVLVAMTVPGK